MLRSERAAVNDCLDVQLVKWLEMLGFRFI